MLRQLCLYILQFFYNSKQDIEIITIFHTDDTICIEKPIIQIQMENTLCELCNEREQLSELPCKHKICKGCLETQKLYTIKSCFICENKNWSELPSTFF
jgi:hypothetical protein